MIFQSGAAVDMFEKSLIKVGKNWEGKNEEKYGSIHFQTISWVLGFRLKPTLTLVNM